MEIKRIIQYNGRKYRASVTNPKYYYNDVYYEPGKSTKVGLHRQTFIDNYGPIPEGHDIHHIDEDTLNNHPSNLEAIEKSKHRRHHQTKRMADPISRAKSVAGLRNNSHKAAAWHASEEGLKWHSQNGIRAWDNREKIVKRCKLCEQEFETFLHKKGECCSNKCWQRFRYKEKKDFETRICIQCNKEFSIRKYEKPLSCSRKCGSLFRWANKRLH